MAPALILPGREAPPAKPVRLQAGPLAMLFEPESAFVRRVFLGRREVLRAIYMAVRDRNWGTVPPRVENLEQDIQADRFQLSFAVDCRAGDIRFRWKGQVTGTPDGTLRYVFDGEALTSFLKNRIGLCVLHPLRECCGAPAWYEQANGERGETSFPTLIEPQIRGRAPLSNLRRLAQEVMPGCRAEVEFEGDLFEMEDQRNWTDASFKTYGTPLALPFPVEIQAGTHLRQAITLRLLELEHVHPTSQLTPAGLKTCRIEEDQRVSETALAIPREPIGPMPQLGLGAASHGSPLSAREVSRLAALSLSHSRVDLRMADPGWPQVLTRVADEAQQLGMALELAVHLGLDGSEPALADCGALLKRIRVPVARVLAFRQTEPASSLATLRAVRRLLGLGEVPIGGGSDAHFCELNREQALGRFGLEESQFVSWPMTPQVHTFDDLSVMENLEAQPHTVNSARAFAQDKPLVISPITLRPRCNAVAIGEEPTDPALPPPPVDPRQLSRYTAAWTLGSVAALADSGVESLTYFETTGGCGLMETIPPSVRHPRFPSLPGMVFPVYGLFAALAGFHRMAPVPRPGLCPQTLASLCLFDAQGKRRLLCANLTAGDLPLVLDLGLERASVRTLKEDAGDHGLVNAELTWSQIVPHPCPAGILRLVLPAYAVASIDSGLPT